MVRRGRGTTFIELLVVMSIFTILTVVLLSFFAFASRSTRKHENLSKKYREMIAVMDRVEMILAGSKVVYADGRQIAFVKLNHANPIVLGGLPNFEPVAQTLMAQAADSKSTNAGRLVLVEKGKSNLIVDTKGDSIGFSMSCKTDPSQIRHYQGPLVISYLGHYVPEEGIGASRSYLYQRAITFEEF